MINYNPKAWLQIIFHSYSKQVMKTLMPMLIFMAVFSSVVCYIFLERIEFNHSPLSTTAHSLLGIVLGLFLVFRTNSAYDRWWEGRRLWGSLVNSTRNFALKLNASLPQNHVDRKWFAIMISNFIFATKEHLRTGVDITELEIPDEEFLTQLKNFSHKPNFIAGAMYKRVDELMKSNTITGFHLTNLDKELKDLIDFMGACERIKKTPIPYSYTMYIKKFIFIYIITLPLGFVSTFGYFTVPTVVLIGYILLSVELIAEEIEDPFGRDVNDLPTDDLAKAIKANVREILSVV